MADSTAYVNLSYVVNDLINELGAAQHKKFRNKYLQIAVGGLRELNLYHFNKFKQEWIDVSDSLGTVAWPTDLVKWLAIGINSNGRLWTFTRDNKIIIPEGTIEGQDTLSTTRGENTTIEKDISANLGTRGGVNTNYFTVDEANRRFVINGDDVSEVLVQYISSGVNMSAESVIPIQGVRAIKDFVVWRVTRKQSDYQTYAISAKDLRDFENAFSEEEFYDMMWKTSFRGVKRG